jgi:hypothetical protein
MEFDELRNKILANAIRREINRTIAWIKNSERKYLIKEIDSFGNIHCEAIDDPVKEKAEGEG